MNLIELIKSEFKYQYICYVSRCIRTLDNKVLN